MCGRLYIFPPSYPSGVLLTRRPLLLRLANSQTRPRPPPCSLFLSPFLSFLTPFIQFSLCMSPCISACLLACLSLYVSLWLHLCVSRSLFSARSGSLVRSRSLLLYNSLTPHAHPAAASSAHALLHPASSVHSSKVPQLIPYASGI
jgi:hypothetical protein